MTAITPRTRPADMLILLGARGRHRLLPVILLTAFSACSGTQVSAQVATNAQTCNAANCEDEAIVVTAVDAAVDGTEFCGGRAVHLLSTLHPAPYTAFSDGVRGRGLRRGLPSSPATLRLEDVGILSPRRFRHQLTIVDSADVQRGSLEDSGCLVVASPPTVRENSEMRVIVGVSELSGRQSIQHFVFLRREGSRWIVSRREVGYRS
jgi:hypothetical protein